MQPVNTDQHRAQLLLPQSALSSLIFMAVERDTRGHHFSDTQRFNYYPASPFPTISWIFEGQLHIVKSVGTNQAPKLSEPLPKIIFAGPHTHPSASWSTASVHALTVSFYPETLGQILNIPMASYVNQICPIESIAHSEWMSVFNKVLKTSTAPHFEPFDYLQNTLMDKLAHTQNINATQPNIRHWLRTILTQASFSRTGYSLRQIQRRIKHWTGQNHRDLQL